MTSQTVVQTNIRANHVRAFGSKAFTPRSPARAIAISIQPPKALRDFLQLLGPRSPTHMNGTAREFSKTCHYSNIF